MKRFLFGSSRSDAQSPSQEPLRNEIDRMVRLLRELLQDGLADQFAEALHALTENGDDLRKAIVIGIEVIHRLIQAAEQRYPNQHGRLKKSIVKSAVRYLIDRDRFDIPAVPKNLEPFVLNVVVDWVIDVAVAMTNDHGLWDTGKATGFYIWAPFAPLVDILDAISANIWQAMVAVLAAVSRFLHEKVHLTPELKAALDEAVKQRLLSKKTDLLGRVPEAIVWIGEHSDELKKVVELVFEGVQLAEGFLDKNGQQKKEYVRNLVLVSLQEFGISFGNGLIAAFVDAFLDTAIDSAVNTFNTFPRHSPAFKHRKRTVSVAAPSVAPSGSTDSMEQTGILGWKLRLLRRMSGSMAGGSPQNISK